MPMPLFLLTFGILTTVFLSTLWNAGQVAMSSGGKRMTHMLIVGLMVAILALLGLSAPAPLVQVLAGLLIAATVTLCVSDRAKNWPICAIQCAFGAIVVSGLPFSLA